MPLYVIWGFSFILFWVAARGATSEGAKRILIVHSFGSAAPPFTTHSIAFETELTQRMGERVDLDEVSLDYARYADADIDAALVDYLQKRQAKWQPDLVVPIGSPAGIFVAKYRERLFPQTPILYAGMDRRRLPTNALQKNATFVGESFDGPGFIEDILQLKPDTTNVVCVIGASPVERYWATAFQSEFARFTNRVSFTWLNDLPFDQMLERVKTLPPGSFIFLILLMRDAAGVTHNADEALRRISEVANAPVNSIYEHQLGLGIVGGRLYRAESEGVESARIAIRILHGEPASSFSPVIVGPVRSQYDWRELRRWKISDNRLPLGSLVKYRVPTLWERYGSFILTGLLVLVLQAILILGLVANLSRRRRAERFLRESQERMKLAAGAAQLGMWEWDFTTNKLWMDRRSRERMGAGNDNNSDFSQFLRTIHPEDQEGVAQAMAKARSGDGIFEHAYRRVLADGKVSWIAGRARVEFDAEHKPLKMRGVSMDITARRLAEERARESERQFFLMANSAPVLIWTSGPDKRCTFVNQGLLEFRGRTLGQDLGDGWVASVHPEDLNHCLKTYIESFDARQPFTMEYRMKRHDGQYRWVLDQGVPRYDSQKKFLGYIGSCVDVTERKESEAEAQRSQQELAHVSRVSMLGALAGSLAHELNQPLGAIVTNAEAVQLLMNGDRWNDKKVRDVLKDVVTQGQRAAEIIEGMRAMLKKDPGQMVAQDLNLLVSGVLEMLHSDLVLKRVRPLLRLHPLLPPVKGHPVQLRQVLLNLVMNACDAMSGVPPDRRRLTIESRRVTETEVEVSVTDSGPGFPDEMLRHEFEPFRTSKAKGLGLGLAICRSIIATHGGRLVAANNADKGATARFTLPVQNGQQPQHEVLAAKMAA
jgi:PAS domain S-box-containing protein